MQGAVNAGVGGGSSGVIGMQSSISSQTGQQFGFSSQNEGFSSRLSQLSQQAADALSKYKRIGSKALTLYLVQLVV